MRFRKSVSALQSVVLLTVCNFAWPGSLYASNDSQVVARKADAAAEAGGKALRLAAGNGKGEEPDAPAVEKYLLEGKLRTGESALLAELKEHKNDDQLRFGLGTLQFLRAVEQLVQDLHRYGLRDSFTRGLNFIPVVRLPVPSNTEPERLSYQKAQNMMRTFLENLAKAEATLAPITDANVKLPLHFGMIRMDLNGDGKVDEEESLWKLYAGLNGNRHATLQKAEKFYISFDRGDVHWLRGYCHLLMTFCEFYLAYDSKETFDCTAHIFFPKVDSPYKFLSDGKHKPRVHKRGDDVEILDFIALIHLIRWPVAEPERMAAALHHMEAVVAQSKESWKWIMAETDDDHEWLPNPSQTGVIPDIKVSKEMVEAWLNLMDQSGKVLAGELLIPFWRGDESLGINLRKVFLEPRAFDLVLWVQGPAAAPYLEKGKMTEPGTWNSLQQAFGGQFPGFALWFN